MCVSCDTALEVDQRATARVTDGRQLIEVSWCPELSEGHVDGTTIVPAREWKRALGFLKVDEVNINDQAVPNAVRFKTPGPRLKGVLHEAVEVEVDITGAKFPNTAELLDRNHTDGLDCIDVVFNAKLLRSMLDTYIATTKSTACRLRVPFGKPGVGGMAAVELHSEHAPGDNPPAATFRGMLMPLATHTRRPPLAVHGLAALILAAREQRKPTAALAALDLHARGFSHTDTVLKRVVKAATETRGDK